MNKRTESKKCEDQGGKVQQRCHIEASEDAIRLSVLALRQAAALTGGRRGAPSEEAQRTRVARVGSSERDLIDLETGEVTLPMRESAYRQQIKGEIIETRVKWYSGAHGTVKVFMSRTVVRRVPSPQSAKFQASTRDARALSDLEARVRAAQFNAEGVSALT